MIIAMTTDRNDATPGFVESVKGNALDWMRDREGGTKTESWIGTEALRILDVRRTGDTLAIDYCDNVSGMYKPDSLSKPTKWVRVTSSPNPYSYQITVNMFGKDLPPANQHGPADRAQQNVFGSWTTLDLDSRDLTAPSCKEGWDGKFSRLPATLPLTTAPTRTTYPGWPAGNQ
ncbi:MAG: hypothetical protein WBA38_09680 [Gordonia sp. (in: high G+C Gram-positive bacteria)]|uniref:hypothetical protein n=2 Tax=Gordonia sp. (in: high G+C Gram-positive bacteria) TaxID=84139 RepID=UPI003C75F881